MIKYWHELSSEQQQNIIDPRPNKNGYNHSIYADSYIKYSKPNWCGSGHAMDGHRGCLSLYLGDIHYESQCKKCKNYQEVIE